MTKAGTGPRLPPLVPTGTARGLFLGPDAEADPQDGLGQEARDLLLARDVAEPALLAAWEVARWADPAPLSERRALALLVVALLEAIDAGGTFLSLGADLPASLARLGLSDADRQAVSTLAAALVERNAPPPVAALFGTPGDRRPFNLAGRCLYTERLWHTEDHLVGMLRARLAAKLPHPAGIIDDALATAAITGPSSRLTDEQVAAVRAALTQPLTVIAGGPGTGKTSIVVAILRALARLQVPVDRIALAAPTGRAAQRIEESVGAALAALEPRDPRDADLLARFRGARTLHRLLGIRPARASALEADAPEFYDRWPLPHAFVIVDEASMIDLPLMDRLVAATAPDARLILLGDADQLPSVEVGAVFRELVAGEPAHARRLTRSHRMNPQNPAGAEILAAATAVNAGVSADAAYAAPPRPTAAELTFSGFERLAAGGRDGLLARWHHEVLDGEAHTARALGWFAGDDAPGDAAFAQALLKTHAAARILCVTRTAGRRTSAAAINDVLHQQVQAAALARGAGERLAAAPYLPGEPVIMLRNDPARGLSNGDLGVVVRRAAPRG
ncbi:MAG: AAA family ATPase, partial [Verrucomicrobiota bacterium]